jgi:hypothetical protein
LRPTGGFFRAFGFGLDADFDVRGFADDVTFEPGSGAA